MTSEKFRIPRSLKLAFAFVLAAAFASCGWSEAGAQKKAPVKVPANTTNPSPEAAPAQAELLRPDHTETDDPIGSFDFRNYSYPLPRGWQEVDGKDLSLVNGFRRTTEEKIGMEYLTTKYFDATGDGEDEAIVILQIGTAGSAIPHLVYVFQWKEDKPDLIWYFRTGDRADGGLKRIYPEDGDIAVELFGQDRYIYGEMETLKITGDDFQLCCPKYYTKTKYKWKNGSFRMDGDRLTYSISDPDAAPVPNLGQLKAKEAGESRK